MSASKRNARRGNSTTGTAAVLARVSALLLAAGAANAQQQSVLFSPHNLSAGGPGRVRALSENEVCIFCHAPHNAAPIRPLWNRVLPTEGYSIYTSRALNAQPGQPTGTSKMCFSCHDGTIALGTVVSRDQPIVMAGGTTSMPMGPGHIGTDLRDDHPISFRFDSGLVGRDAKLKDPSSLPPQIKLDQNAELQCTSCHDAHNNALGKFLVMRNDTSNLCTSCHQVGPTAVSGHSNCNACHQPHSAPSGPYLLRRQTVTGTCLSCHDGSVPQAPNVAAALRRASAHDTGSQVDPPPPLANHVNCADCHDPHTMGHGSGSGVTLPANFGRIDGVSDAGAPIATATFTHQVCFKCHADTNTRAPLISRQIQQPNLRLKFSPSSASFHPVMATGRNPNVPSLRAPWTTGSRVGCADCHNSDTGHTAGGADPSGVHGSNFDPVLLARYDTSDFTTESAQAYALCYRCHDRSSILDNRSFKEHKKHIVDLRTPCAACHDSHGIAAGQGSASSNTNLINFATSIVQPDPVTGRLEFRDTGTYRGECFLRCHGENHSPERYER